MHSVESYVRTKAVGEVEVRGTWFQLSPSSDEQVARTSSDGVFDANRGIENQSCEYRRRWSV